MLHYIEQSCTDFTENQGRMINSILQRTQEMIVEVDNDLITDPALIRFNTVKHFQNCVGRPTTDGTIPEDWSQEYSPIGNIDASIFQHLMGIPTFEEWFDFAPLQDPP